MVWAVALKLCMQQVSYIWHGSQDKGDWEFWIRNQRPGWRLRGISISLKEVTILNQINNE